MTFGNKALAAAIAGVMSASSASAATFIIDSATNTPLVGKAYATFNNLTLGNTTQQTGTGITVSFTGSGAVVQGSVASVYAAPIVSNGNGALFGQADGVDTTTYITSGIGSATLTFAIPTTYVGMLIGSVDPYNTITFNTADGMTQSFTGSQIGFLGTSRYVNFSSSSPILSIVTSSTGNAFEFDNVAVNAAIPEPATWAMMLAGFGAVGFAMRRRQRATLRVLHTA